MTGCPNLREALAEARRLGCDIRVARRTGELVISHPLGGRVRQNLRRKDTNRDLLVLLRKVARALEGDRP